MQPAAQQLTLWGWRDSRVERTVDARGGPYRSLVWQPPLWNAEGRLVLMGQRSLLLLRAPSLDGTEARAQ